MEIIIVIGILGVLTAAIVPLTLKEMNNARIAKALKDTQDLYSAINSFYKDTGFFPRKKTSVNNDYYTTANSIFDLFTDSPQAALTVNQQLALDHLVQNTLAYPNWNGPYLNTEFNDPWNRPYLIGVQGYCPGAGTATPRYVWAISFGANGTRNTQITDATIPVPVNAQDTTRDDIGTLLFTNQVDPVTNNTRCW